MPSPVSSRPLTNGTQKNIRTELSNIRRTTHTEMSAIRADHQVLQEVQTAQGIEQAAQSTVSPPPLTPAVANTDTEHSASRRSQTPSTAWMPYVPLYPPVYPVAYGADDT